MKKIILLITVILIGCSKSDTKEALHNAEQSFETINTTVVDSINIEQGDSINVFSVESVAKIGDHFFISDPTIQMIHKVDSDGEIINSWGGAGAGPKEFYGLDWIGSYDGNVIARDGKGNLRFSIFDLDGSPVRTIPIAANGPYTNTKIIDEDRLIITGGLKNCSNSPELCTVSIQDVSGNFIRSIAGIDQVEKDHVGLPFYVSVNEAEKEIFVAHVYGQQFSKFDLEGNLLGSYDLNQSGNLKFIDKSKIRKNDPYSQFEVITNSSITPITRMYFINGYLLIEFMRKGKDFNGLNERFINVYSPEGEFIKVLYESDARLISAEDNRVYLLETKSGENFLNHYIRILNF